MENQVNHEIVELGRKAKRVRDSQDFKDIIERIYADLFKQFRKTNFNDASAREDIHQMSYAVEYLEAKLKSLEDAADYEIKTNVDDFDAE